MHNDSGVSRRQFLRSSALGAGAVTAPPYLAPSRVLGANDRIRAGVTGVGNRGNLLIREAPANPQSPRMPFIQACSSMTRTICTPKRRCG